MNIKDLKIGNWVLEFGEVTQIVQLDMGGKTFYRINDMQVHKKTFLTGGKVCIEPIRLTKKWLINFGFGEVHKNTFFLPKYSSFDIYMYEGSSCKLFYDNIDLDVCLEYVHQLQNLYYALTGKALELQPS